MCIKVRDQVCREFRCFGERGGRVSGAREEGLRVQVLGFSFTPRHKLVGFKRV